MMRKFLKSFHKRVPSKITQCYCVILLSCVFFAFCSLFTDFITDIGVNEILWWRFLLSTIITITYTLFTPQRSEILSAWRNKTVALSAVFGTITATFTVFALRNLPIGEATLLLSSAPIFTVILSGLILGEKLKLSDYMALFVAATGAVFVAQPSIIFGRETGVKHPVIFYVAIIVALGRGLFKAAKFIAVSSTDGNIPTILIVVYLSFLGFVVLSSLNILMVLLLPSNQLLEMKISFVLPSLENFTYMAFMAIFYFLQQFCVCLAMRYGKPARASLIKYLDIVLPLVFQVTVFKVYPNGYTIAGCFMIILAMLAVLLVKRSDDDEDCIDYEQLDKSESKKIFQDHF